MKNIEDIKILVVGDIMLDKYVVGDVKRISPEAPVPIVKVTDEYSTLGGCGNVARNIAGLGVHVDCATSIADDSAGQEISMAMNLGHIGRILTHSSNVTTVKERIIADQRKVQMLRIDRETTSFIDHNELIEEIYLHLHEKEYDIIVVSDYAKGLITADLMNFLRKAGIPIIVDPKPKNAHYYGMITMMTPNKDEMRELELLSRVHSEFTLVTEGKDGMTLYDYRQGYAKIKIPGEPVEVYNVSGAGDTVVAVMAICLAMDIYPDKAARVANSCAAYVVTQPGTSIVPKNIFKRSMNTIGARM